jgi:hypothetical protein
MKATWRDVNALATEDHGNFWLPRRRLKRSLKDHLWLVALGAVSVVVWVAIHAAIAA